MKEQQHPVAVTPGPMEATTKADATTQSPMSNGNLARGARLKDLREKKGLSQEELANKCGWPHQSRLAHYEVGRRTIGPDEAIELAAILEVHPSVILFGDMHGQPPLSIQNHSAFTPSSSEAITLEQLKQHCQELDAKGFGYMHPHVSATTLLKLIDQFEAQIGNYFQDLEVIRNKLERGLSQQS